MNYLTKTRAVVTWALSAIMILAVLATTVASAYVTVGEPIKVSWVYGDFSQWVNDVSWSPDGERLAIGVGKSLIVLNRDGTLNWSKDGLGASQFDDVRSVAWSPDGELIAVGYYYSGVVEVFNASGDVVWSREVSSSIMVLRWSPDGGKIAVQSGEDVYVVSREGEVLWHAEDLGFNVMDVAWSPDGSMVAAACMERGVILRDGEIVLNVTRPRGSFLAVDWSPGGDVVAFGVGSYVAVVDLNGSQVWVMNSFSGDVMDIDWCPDGSCVAAATERRVIVFSPNGTILRESDAVGEKFLNLAWSPDGSLLAVTDRGGRLVVFDVEAGVSGYSLMRFEETDIPLKACVSGPGGERCFPLLRGGTDVYVTPGEYGVEIYIADYIEGVTVLGDFWRIPIAVTNVTAGEGGGVGVEVPRKETLGHYLAILELTGDPGQEVFVEWPGNDGFVDITSSGTATAYLVPGLTYNISYVINGEYVRAATITVEAGRTYRVGKPSPEQATTTTTQPPTTTTTTTTATTQTTATTTTTTTTAVGTETGATEPAEPGAGAPWVLIAAAAVIIVAVAAVMLRRR